MRNATNSSPALHSARCVVTCTAVHAADASGRAAVPLADRWAVVHPFNTVSVRMNLATATVLPAPAGVPHGERRPLLLQVPLPSSVDARAPPRETPPASASYRSSRTWSSGHAPSARPHCSMDLTRRAAPRLGNPARSGRNPRRAAPQEGALALYNGLSAGFTRQVRPGRRAARRPPRCLHALEREHLAHVLCVGGGPSQAVSETVDIAGCFRNSQHRRLLRRPETAWLGADSRR